MRSRSDKRPSHKHDRKVLMAEESTKSWADTDSESSSSSSSSSDSEHEEVHCLMADQTSNDENSPKLSDNEKAGIGFSKPESSKPSWLKNRLDKDKTKAGRKPFVPNQPWRSSTKVKSGWIKNQSRRDLNGQKMKSKLNIPHNYAHTLKDIYTGKTVKVVSHRLTQLQVMCSGGTVDNQLREACCVGNIPVAMFETLITTGLKNFLGCPVVFYEAALTEFFKNGSVRDGLVVSTVNGVTVEISENVQGAVTRERFMLMTAITFDVKVNWSNLLFGVLKAMVTPGSRQAKGFAIQIGVMLQKVPGLELGDSRPFPASRVLTEKTVHRFVHINDKVGMEDTAASPRVKKTPVKKAVSKKRQVGAGEEAPVMKKKCTTKGKPAAIALETVPLQIIETTAEMPAEQPSKPKRKTQKRKRRLVLDDADETGDSAPEQPAAEIAAGAQDPIVDDPVATQPDIVPTVEATTDDPDAIVKKILNQLDTVVGTDGGDQPAAPATESTPWFDLPFMLARREAEGLLSSDTDEDLEQIFTEIDTAGTTAGTVSIEQTLELVDEIGPVTRTVSSKKVAEEHMSIDDILLQISDDMMLPSVTAAEITKIRLGKVILEEDEPVKGNPAREMVELICGDVEFLVRLRDRVMIDVVDFFHSFSLNKLSNLDALRDLKEKEKLMLEWAGTDSLEMAPWTATASQIIDLLTVAHSKSLEVLLAQQREHGLPMEQPCTSTFLDASIGSGAVLAQFFFQAKSTCWVRPMVLIDGVWTPIQGTDFWRSSCKLSLFVNRKKLPETVIEDTFVPHVFFIEPVQYWGAAPSFIKTWGWARVCTDIVRYHMFGCLRPVREDVCTYIVVYNLGVERIPASFRGIFQQCIYTDSFVGYFNDLDVQNLSDFEESSSDGSTVYRSPSPLHDEPLALGPGIPTVAQEEQLYFVQSPESPPATFPCLETYTSSTSLSMHFDADDIPLDDTADIQTSLPSPESPSPISPRQESSSSSTDVSLHFDQDDILLDDNANVQPTLSDVLVAISPFFDDLKTYLSQRMDTANSDILSRLHTVERGIQDTLGQQNDYFRGLIQSARQDAQTQDNIQTLRFNEFRKNILAQNASIFTGLADVRKEVQELNAKVDIMATNLEIVKKDVETSKEAISHQLLEFQAQAQANHNILHVQLSELVSYINRGGDAKKGEGTSRGPQPSPVDQNRGSGNTGGVSALRPSDIIEGIIDADRRTSAEDLMHAERERDRARRERRLSIPCFTAGRGFNPAGGAPGGG
ncbi:golgin candidate 5 [Dorcoceras hygrometricum]|uniref:Golgin candidate 5 n=1 Tax=Dorcoceras hygrometricum TaxID=472368 RepID=A0A2Z7D9C8_9LAMI|nr:golgin candidate 5 [Dorcoceras hygrometricum]